MAGQSEALVGCRFRLLLIALQDFFSWRKREKRCGNTTDPLGPRPTLQSDQLRPYDIPMICLWGLTMCVCVCVCVLWWIQGFFKVLYDTFAPIKSLWYTWPHHAHVFYHISFPYYSISQWLCSTQWWVYAHFIALCMYSIHIRIWTVAGMLHEWLLKTGWYTFEVHVLRCFHSCKRPKVSYRNHKE